jgi:RIO-like serine/threonine protein kinase
MNYEIHVTLETPSIENFIEDCNAIGVKPIIIETQNNKDFGIQIMTSSKHNGECYKETLNNIVSYFRKKYNILRQKVEIQPTDIIHDTHIYYESHLRLKLNKDFNTEVIKELCKLRNFHFSKNLFKKDIDCVYQMITYREYNTTLPKFVEIINAMSTKLKELDINCDKVEIEECIYDSNINVDNNWLKN